MLVEENDYNNTMGGPTVALQRSANVSDNGAADNNS